jgi:hypothetical protein
MDGTDGNRKYKLILKLRAISSLSFICVKWFVSVCCCKATFSIWYVWECNVWFQWSINTLPLVCIDMLSEMLWCVTPFTYESSVKIFCPCVKYLLYCFKLLFTFFYLKMLLVLNIKGLNVMWIHSDIFYLL